MTKKLKEERELVKAKLKETKKYYKKIKAHYNEGKTLLKVINKGIKERESVEEHRKSITKEVKVMPKDLFDVVFGAEKRDDTIKLEDLIELPHIKQALEEEAMQLIPEERREAVLRSYHAYYVKR